MPVRFSYLKHLARIISWLALAALLQACSAVKLTYNQAPQLAYWYLDDYFDFSTVQRPALNDSLARVQQWHRQTELPGYIDTLQKLQQQLPLEVAAEQACEVYAEGRRGLQRIAEQMEPAALEVVASLEASQLAQLEKKFAKLNAKFRKDYVEGSPQALHAQRLSRAVKRTEMLYGKLEEGQLVRLENSIRSSSFSPSVNQAERTRRQQDTLQTLQSLLNEKTSDERAKTAVRALMQRHLRSPNPAFRSYEEGLRLELCQTFAEVHNSTNPSQRLHAVQTLKKYAQDLRLLSQQ